MPKPRPTVTPREFAALAEFIHGVTGIYLEPAKTYLVETRLGGLVAELGCATYGEFLARVRGDRGGDLVRRVVDAITTNETLFFRDQEPFDALRHALLPELVRHRRAATLPGVRPTLRLWSAACATGQEVYSAAVVALEVLAAAPDVALQLLGTDLSEAAVARARAGRYGAFEVERGLPPHVRDRYFRPVGGGAWQARDELKAPCSFQRLNLLEPFHALGRFDLVLCRNVAIYFREEARRALFDRLADALEPWGVLIIGAAEFLTGVSPRFTAHRHQRAVYYTLAEAPRR